jgi:Uma2 family endonuclease
MPDRSSGGQRMTNETALEQPELEQSVWMGDPDWAPPMPPTDLIFDDGEPLESNRHRIAMNVLIRSAQSALRDRPDSFVGGNMFVYYSRNQTMNRDFRGPDFFAVLGVDENRERQGWVVCEEAGRYPDVIIELLSPSTATTDRGSKKDLYEQTFKTTDYFIFDPFTPTSLEGWQLVTSQGYQPLQPNEQGWLWCETLGLWLGTWEGAIDQEPVSGTCHWLRFYDRDNTLVLLPEEVAQQQADQERQRAEQEYQRAERLAARLRELGVNPDDF